MQYSNQLLCGDALDILRDMPDETVDMCLTSPPYYGLRDYGVCGQLGQEDTPQAYIDRLSLIFSEVHRVLKPSGTLWLNIGDSYAGSMQGAGTKAPSAKQQSNRGTLYMMESSHKSPLGKLEGYKPKDMLGIPWHLAFTLREDGWFLRQDIIWNKPNVLPSSVKDRCTSSYEHVFLLSKSKRYFFDSDAIKEPAKYAGDDRGSRKDARRGQNRNAMCGKTGAFRNKRDVWSINTEPFKGAHFACFPTRLAQTCILAGCPADGLVLDPFMGAGTTALTALTLHRHYVGIELNPDYIALAQARINERRDAP